MWIVIWNWVRVDFKLRLVFIVELLKLYYFFLVVSFWLLYEYEIYNWMLFFFFFIRMFELNVIIFIIKDLCISVMDYDVIGWDDFIGEIVVDLENRFLFCFCVNCGFF